MADDDEKEEQQSKTKENREKNESQTGFFNAFRRKNDLQLSHEITSKLKPLAGESQIVQRSVVLVFVFVFVFDVVVVSFRFSDTTERMSSSNASINIDLHNAI